MDCTSCCKGGIERVHPGPVGGSQSKMNSVKENDRREKTESIEGETKASTSLGVGSKA